MNGGFPRRLKSYRTLTRGGLDSGLQITFADPPMSPIAIEDGFKIAVLIPCHNQAATIGAVVRGFVEALPGAKIFVFDNNSTDDTARIATREGARVYREARQGKGNVVRRMFADIDADIYVLADGDGSYDPADAPSLVNALITEHVDMVVGTRHGANGSRVPAGFRRTRLRLALPPLLRRRPPPTSSPATAPSRAAS